MIEGTLKYLDRRIGYCGGMMLWYIRESYVKRYETKYYFTLVENPEILLTFTEVHLDKEGKPIFKEQVDTLKDHDASRFDGKHIMIFEWTEDKDHIHLGLGPPEIRPYNYKIDGGEK